MTIENEEEIRQYIIKNFTRSKCVIECLIFLYFNKNSYSYSEIWENIKNKVDLLGSTPDQTCATEIRRYTKNAPMTIKRTPNLFKIINLNVEGEVQKFKLLEKIEKQIDNSIAFISNVDIWMCSNDSCGNRKIKIKRNNGIIDTGTWRKIILHFLRHLKLSITYFGPSTFEKFLGKTLEDLLSEEDKGLNEYETAKEEFWKNRIRTALGQLNDEKYIITDNTSDDISFKKHFRSRRRTDRFLQEFELYNDWEDTQFWTCPKRTCGNKKILMTRNEENFIDQSTYRKIIIHFLQHLKKNNKYFSSAEIYNIFLKNISENSLYKEDKSPMPSRPADPRWKHQIRSTLESIKNNQYLKTDKMEKIPKIYQVGIQNNRSLRTTKRTNLFFQNHKIYDDWRLYSIDETQPLEVEEDSIEFAILDPTSKSPFLEIKNNNITSNSHGQIQKKEVYDFFKRKAGEIDERFTFKLNYFGLKNEKVYEDNVSATTKGKDSYAVLLITYMKNLIDQGYCEPMDLLPRNILKFSKIKNDDAFLLEIIKKGYSRVKKAKKGDKPLIEDSGKIKKKIAYRNKSKTTIPRIGISKLNKEELAGKLLKDIQLKIRNFICSKLIKEYGYEKWWDKGVPFNIREDVKQRLKNKRKIEPKRRYKNQDMLNFNECGLIILYKKNWKSIFSNFFFEKHRIQYLIQRLVFYRNEYAHLNFREEDLEDIKFCIRDIEKFIS